MSIRMLLLVVLASISINAQSEDAYASTDGEQGTTKLFDPSRLSVRHSLSFGAFSGASGMSDLKSQSLYTTMMQYQFTAPVTLNLNFGLPIHSTFSQANNLNATNLQSLDYFKSIPFEVSLNWQPTETTQFQISIFKGSSSGYYPNYYGYGYYGDMYRPWDSFNHFDAHR
jgi:hypothetical protein